VSASRSAAPPVVAPPSGHPRFPEIDSLRAIAALLVVVAHAAVFGGFSTHTWWGSMWNHLTIGVPIFFVISGFLLYRPFLAAQVLGLPPTTVGAYAWRRLLRIVPAYWLALTLLGWWVNLHGVFTHDWWRYYLFLQVYSTHTLYGGILPAWTLCVEVSFYVLLPVYAAVMGRAGARVSARPRLRLELVVLAALAIASLTLRTIDLAGPRTVLPNTLLENFDWFAAGMALAVVSVAAQDSQPLAAAGRWVSRWPLAAWGGAVAVYAIMAGVLMNPVVLNHGIFYETPWGGLAQHIGFGLVALLFVAPAVFPSPRGLPARLLKWRTLAWLGLISYGIYLWHDPLLGKLIQHGGLSWWPGHAFLVLTAATAVATVAAAAASYYVVERPILALKTFTPRRRRLAAAPLDDRADGAPRQVVPPPGDVHRSGARH
jgi:peptidoglycan/LPS O-acetylase OafA/YrhL